MQRADSYRLHPSSPSDDVVSPGVFEPVKRLASRCSVEVLLAVPPPFASMLWNDAFAPSLTPCVSRVRLTEIRAAQRTFEGAYMRTAIGQFSFALIILRIFTSEFYPIGALFAAYGAAVLLVAIFRRYEGNRQFFDQELSDSETDDDDEAAGPGGQSGGAAATASGRRRVQTISKRFRTSGNSVTLLTMLSLGAYITLLVLMLRLDK